MLFMRVANIQDISRKNAGAQNKNAPSEFYDTVT